MTEILGQAMLTASTLRAYLSSINPDAPDFSELFISEGEVEEVRGDLAFCQMLLETGNLTFEGSAVTLEQYNLYGCGVIENGQTGDSFESPEIGVRAFIQHLKGYATEEPLVNECVDPRYKYIVKGCAPYVEYLGIQENPIGKGWAAGEGYGEKILNIYANVAAYSGISTDENNVGESEGTMSKYLIALDDGHGMDTAGKRTPYVEELEKVVLENEFNRAVVGFLDVELKRCGFDTIQVAPTDEDTSLSERVAVANAAGADLYISIHYNAYDGEFNDYDPSGVEIYYYPGSEKGKLLAECIYSYLMQGTEQNSRGVKTADFYVLRNTTMPAVLSENGFMDNLEEALLMVKEDFQKEVAREHAQGICEYMGITYVEDMDAELELEGESDTGLEEETDTKTLYRVQIGAYGIKANADTMLEKIKAAGFDAFIAYSDNLYRVQVGAYSIKANADAMLAKIKAAGFDAFITKV